MRSGSNVKVVIKTVESRLAEEDKHMTRISKAPLPSEYRPKIDFLGITGPDSANWFQNFIEILNWIIEISRVDINNSVAQLSTIPTNPRASYLQYSLHVFPT